MSTPPFKPSNGEFSTVRFFTDKDPYHYTVDNRPVGDVDSNVGELVKATDAARRAVVLEAIGNSAFESALVGPGDKTVGLGLGIVSGYTLALSRGVLLSYQAISTGDPAEIIKKAALPTPQSLTLSAPVSVGREVPYLVQIRHADYGTGVPVPYEDQLNEYLPSTTINGKLEVSVVVGAEADTGTSVEPTVTPGWLPLFLVVSANGQPPVITDATGHPDKFESVLPDLLLRVEDMEDIVLEIEEPFTTAEKNKLALIEPAATANPDTDSLDEGANNLYHTAARVRSVALTGLSLASSVAVAAADTVLSSIGKLQAQVSLKLAIAQAFTDTAVSGTNSKSSVTLTVDPSGNSSQVLIANKVQTDYNSSSNMTVGGYLVSGQDVLNTSGTGTHDKLVTRMVQMNVTGGNIAALVGVEGVISQIAPTTMVGGAAIFYVPNMASVPNIGNIGTLAAFSNDEPRAVFRSAGPFLNADLREISPSPHAGLIAGRYYSAPAKLMTTNAMTTSVIYVTYVYVPRRVTITKLGFEVTTAAAGNGRLGLYKVADGVLTTLVVQGSDISTGTIGVKESTVSSQVDSGIYAIVATFSATPTLRWHEINNHGMIGASTATGYSENCFITPFPYGAFPATANILPTFAANTIEPHLWFRVGV